VQVDYRLHVDLRPVTSGHLALLEAGIEGFVDAEAGGNSKQRFTGEIVVGLHSRPRPRPKGRADELREMMARLPEITKELCAELQAEVRAEVRAAMEDELARLRGEAERVAPEPLMYLSRVSQGRAARARAGSRARPPSRRNGRWRDW
jgi:hypothetical protein